jgi:hypothetical protein
VKTNEDERMGGRTLEKEGCRFLYRLNPSMHRSAESTWSNLSVSFSNQKVRRSEETHRTNPYPLYTTAIRVRTAVVISVDETKDLRATLPDVPRERAHTRDAAKRRSECEQSVLGKLWRESVDVHVRGLAILGLLVLCGYEYRCMHIQVWGWGERHGGNAASVRAEASDGSGAGAGAFPGIREEEGRS